MESCCSENFVQQKPAKKSVGFCCFCCWCWISLPSVWQRKLTQNMLMQVPEWVGSCGMGRNKIEIVRFQLQWDITSFQQYCWNNHFDRSLLGQSAGHKTVGTVGRHMASCLVSLGSRTSGLAFLLCDFIEGIFSPSVMQAKQLQSSCEQVCLTETATQPPFPRQIAQDIGKKKFESICEIQYRHA